MTPLIERCNHLQNRISTFSPSSIDANEKLEAMIEDAVSIYSSAISKQNFEALEILGKLNSRISSRVLKNHKENNILLSKCLGSIRFSWEDVREFLETPGASHSDDVIAGVFENLIKHETFYSPANPRIARDILQAGFQLLRDDKVILKLCESIGLSNTRDVSGITCLLHAVDDIKHENSASPSTSTTISENALRDTLSKVLHATKHGIAIERADLKKLFEIAEAHGKPVATDSKVYDLVVDWIIRNESRIAYSVDSSPVCEWSNTKSIEVAEMLGAKILAANMSRRIDEFSFDRFSKLSKYMGFFTDDKHVTHLLGKSSANERTVGELMAYSLTQGYPMSEKILSGNVMKSLEIAADAIGDERLHTQSGRVFLEQIVNRLPHGCDLSKISKTSLHDELMTIRKYRSLSLENDMGM
ncbi:hypothetical protein [Pseudomonas putida]|uniref:Uncharacterized protein n=1 Tax=Pseudomonas putida TaxID=303 RepID=A0A8I1EB08_PSEPU|nr:hypothetical protein [Pseudomonas putida]MBI6882440.1 hypothetical protein [Pseudomonas putida]